MRSLYKTTACAICLLAFHVGNANATPVNSVDASYGSATHHTPYWQELDNVSNTSDDYGVSWSVDGGATYGVFDLLAGQNVQFRVDMHEDHPGTHYANFMKLWVDWGQDGSFDNGTSDVVMFDKRVLRSSQGSPVLDPSSTDHTYISSSYLVDDSWTSLAIRARVTCSESLRQDWNAQWSTSDQWYNNHFAATGYLYQGEVENWTIGVSAVPIPAAAWLFGSGLIGLIGMSRRSK